VSADYVAAESRMRACIDVTGPVETLGDQLASAASLMALLSRDSDGRRTLDWCYLSDAAREVINASGLDVEFEANGWGADILSGIVLCAFQAGALSATRKLGMPPVDIGMADDDAPEVLIEDEDMRAWLDGCDALHEPPV
jgi:hypothetical protein